MTTGTIRWDLLDAQLTRQGELHPTRPPKGERATIDNDTTRPLKRQARGFYLPADEETDVQEFVDRIAPVWIDPDGTERSLGVFMYADANRLRRWGILDDTFALEATLCDQLVIVDQPLQAGISFRAGTNLTNMALTICDLYSIPDPDIDVTGLTCAVPMTWAVGRDSGLDALIDIANLAAFHEPYYDNAGRFTMRAIPSAPSADFTYTTQIVRDSIVESTDVLNAANVFLTIESGSTDSPLVGRYEVPASEPNSIAERGFPVVHTTDMQGLSSQSAANDAARASATGVAFRPVKFDTEPNPSSDTFDIIDYLGTLYLDSSWTLDVDVTGSQSHDLVRL